MIEDFESFYDECIQDDELFTEWEHVKNKKRKKKIVSIIVALIVDVLLFCFFDRYMGLGQMLQNSYFMPYTFLFTFLGLFIIDALVFVAFSIGVDKKYNILYKEKIIDKLLKNFFDDVDYIPKKKMPHGIYKEPKYEEDYNEYDSDDYMEGLLDEKYSIKMAEVTTEQVETTTDSDGNTQTEVTTVFSGLFIVIDLQKSIENELKIKENKTIFEKDKIEMDSEEFEKYFDVSSSNKIIGMQILTHDIMDLLIDYRIRLNKPFDIVIIDNIMYIRLHISQMFEAKFNKKEFIDKKSLEKYFYMVQFIYELSNKMIKIVNETEI